MENRNNMFVQVTDNRNILFKSMQVFLLFQSIGALLIINTSIFCCILATCIVP